MGIDPEAFDGIGSLDGDTTVSHNTFAAAMHAAGSVCQAVDMVARKEVSLDYWYSNDAMEGIMLGENGKELSFSFCPFLDYSVD